MIVKGGMKMRLMNEYIEKNWITPQFEKELLRLIKKYNGVVRDNNQQERGADSEIRIH